MKSFGQYNLFRNISLVDISFPSGAIKQFGRQANLPFRVAIASELRAFPASRSCVSISVPLPCDFSRYPPNGKLARITHLSYIQLA